MKFRIKPSQVPAWFSLPALLILSVVPMLVAMSRLEVSTTTRDLIGQETEGARFESLVRERFAHESRLIALFSGEGLYEDRFLDGLDGLTTELGRDLTATQVLSATNFERIRGQGGDFVVEPLLDAQTRAGLRPAERRDRVLSDEYAPGRLVSKDGAFFMMVLVPENHLDSRQREAMRDRFLLGLQEHGLENHFQGFSGTIAINIAQSESVWKDIRALGLVSLLLGMLLLYWMFRRVLTVLAVMFVSSASLGTALAFIAAKGHPFTLVNIIQIPLLMALAVALLVHLFNALSHQAALGHRGRRQVDRAHAFVHSPALFTALSTAAAFLSLSVSPHPISLFGQSVGWGVLVQYVCVLWLLPSLLARWDTGEWPQQNKGVDLIGRPVTRLALFSMRHSKRILVPVTLFFIGGGALAQRLYYDADPLRFLPARHPVVKTTELFVNLFHGVTTIDVVFTGETRDHFKRVEHLREVLHLRDWAVRQPEVGRVDSLVNVLEDIHWAFHDEAADFRHLPDRDDLIAQYLLFYDRDDVYAHVDRDYQMTRISLFTSLRGSRSVQDFIKRLNREIEAAAWPETSVGFAGSSYLLASNERHIVSGQVRGLAVATLTILALMCMLWRSPAAALVCMLPNLLPVGFVLMTMGWLGLPLNTITAMITSIVLGISVDDTIHIYHGYRDRRLAGKGHVDSILHSYRRAGRAVTASTMILVGGVVVLAFSQFRPLMEFGMLVATGLIAAWLFDTLVLPALLGLAAGAGVLKFPENQT